jgi:hypothetical protein
MQDLTDHSRLLEADRDHLRSGALPEGALAGLFDAIAAETVDRRPTLRERAQELPTRLRVIAAVLSVVGLTGLLAVMTGLRPDLDAGEAVRFGVAMAAVGALLAVAAAVGLRGHHQRPLGPAVWGVLLVALGAPAALALVPGLWLEHGHAQGGAGAVLAPATGCFTMGLVNGAVAAFVVWLFQRSDRAATWRLVAAAVVGGLAAFWSLELHCPSRDTSHMLLGHASVGFVLAGLVLAYAALRARGRAA